MREKLGLSSFSLKIIAIVSMFIDHIGSVIFPEIVVLRIIGRIAFPIFAFLIVEGYFHTRDVKKYMQRLFIFGVISEPFFDFVLHGEFIYLKSQNVFFTLYLGLVLIYICEMKKPKSYGLFVMAGVAAIALFTFCDYSMYGIFMIYCLYMFRGKVGVQLILMGIINVIMLGGLQSFAVFAMIPIYFYNGKPGRFKLKYFFYSFYPLHLVIIWLFTFV